MFKTPNTILYQTSLQKTLGFCLLVWFVCRLFSQTIIFTIILIASPLERLH